MVIELHNSIVLYYIIVTLHLTARNFSSLFVTENYLMIFFIRFMKSPVFNRVLNCDRTGERDFSSWEKKYRCLSGHQLFNPSPSNSKFKEFARFNSFHSFGQIVKGWPTRKLSQLRSRSTNYMLFSLIKAQLGSNE